MMVPQPHDADYEDLLGVWTDLEAGLATVLLQPQRIPDFAAKVRHYDRWMAGLLRQDTDTGLYLLFQLAADRALGYSSAHALICAVLCHLLSHDLALPDAERDSLVGAAMTMNVAMTALQNALAEQDDKPDAAQRRGIDTHADRGRQLLLEAGVADPLWLEVVSIHHQPRPGHRALDELPPARRLGRILHVVDRYAAMISPRRTRGGRSATETVRSLVSQADGLRDQVAHALVRAVGLCPPGTYVRMDNGEIAVVLRRSAMANQPMVASVIGRGGDRLPSPRLHHTSRGAPAIQSAMTPGMLRESARINHQNLLRMGLQAARRDAPA